MPTAVIDHVNVLSRTERSLLVFTDRQGRIIGDYAPTTVEQADAEEDESVVADLYLSIPPAPDVTPGVSSIEEGSADDIPGVELPDVAVLHEPTGVDMGVPQAKTPQCDNIHSWISFSGDLAFSHQHGIYHPIRAAIPNNSTRRTRLLQHTAPRHTRECHPLSCPVPRDFAQGCGRVHVSRPQFGAISSVHRFTWWALPASVALTEGILVSFSSSA